MAFVMQFTSLMDIIMVKTWSKWLTHTDFHDIGHDEMRFILSTI